jgi:hypothetical protein
VNAKALSLRGGALLLAALAAAGCSSDEPKQEFTVPKALCGVSVPTDALSRLLPASGKRVTTEQVDGQAEGTGLCNVSVDDEQVLVVSTERIPVGESARSVLLDRLHVSDPQSAEGGAVAYADRAAASLVECRGAGVDEEDVSTFIKTLEPGRRDAAAMKELISGYTADLRKQQPCHKDG